MLNYTALLAEFQIDDPANLMGELDAILRAASDNNVRPARLACRVVLPARLPEAVGRLMLPPYGLAFSAPKFEECGNGR